LLLSTNAALVGEYAGVLSDIEICSNCICVSVYLCLCLFTDISATVTPIGVTFCMMVDGSRTQSLNFDRKYLKNDKSQRYM